MSKVHACIDGLANTGAVIQWAQWSAQRLGAPLSFVHVLERLPGPGDAVDYSGALGWGAQESLLTELSELDARRARLAQDAGRRLLDSAQAHAAAAGLTADSLLRHGELADTALELEAETRLFVLGEHYHASTPSRIHLDHHVERVLRSVHKPVLVITGEQFTPPQQVLVAYDGSATARKAVQMVAGSPLLAGLPVQLVMAGQDNAAARQALAEARAVLAAAGFQVSEQIVAGDPEQVLPALAKAQPSALIVMGAYGHSRIRHLIAGSTTTTLLRVSEVPVLVLR